MDITKMDEKEIIKASQQDSIVPVYINEPTDEQVKENEKLAAEFIKNEIESQRLQKQGLYQRIADPIFFKYQAGEATKQDWLDARALVSKQYDESLKEGK